MSEALIDKNNDWALGDMLAIETHLQENMVEGNAKIPHTWCVKKHTLHLLNHALSESIIHSEGEQAKQYAEFKEKAQEVLSSPNLTPHDVRELRNEFREIIGDETLGKKNCGVCSLDTRSNFDMKGDETSNVPGKNSSVAVFVVGGLIVAGVIIALIASSRR